MTKCGLLQLSKATDTSAHTTKGLGMQIRIRIACVGRNGHSFALFAAQMQESIGRIYGVESDKSNWLLRRCLEPLKE